MLKFWGLFSTDYCPLRPLTFARDKQTEHFWKALITYHHCGKFQVSVFNSDWEECNVWVFDLFSHQLWPHMTSDLCKRVIKLCIVGKPLWHTTIMSSFKILWSIDSEKFNARVLDLYTDADTNADADDGRIQRNASVHILTLLCKFVNNLHYICIFGRQREVLPATKLCTSNMQTLSTFVI